VKILAIDPATKCGFAHSDGPSGVWILKVRPDESGGMRWFRLQGKLNQIKQSTGVDLVVYEASRNLRHGAAIRVHEGLKSTIELWCTNNECEYRGYSPGEVKKHATGKGNASKEDMVRAAQRKWPSLIIIDDNHADALLLLDLAKDDLGIQ